MIFRTITDEATGATKSIGLFGKSIDELKSIISSVKTNGIFNTFFNTSTIDEEVIDEYNKDIKKAIANNATMAEKQKIMESAINGTNEATARLIKSTKGAIVETKAFKEAQDQSTLSAKAGQVALKGLAIAGSMIASFLIVEVLGLIVNGIDELVHSAEHCKERVDELMSSYKSALDTANANAKTIEGLADRYGELSKGVNDLGENMSLSTDEFQEYNDIVNQIAEMSPTLVQGYTNEGNAILTLKGNVDELRKSYEDARIAAYNMLIASGKDKDGNDIIKDWNNLHKTNFFSSLFDFGKIDVGGKISNSKAVEVLQAISSMSKEDYWDARVATTDKLYEKLSDEQKLIHDNIKFINTNLDYAGAQSDEDYSMLQKEAKTLVQTYNSEIKSSLSNVKTIANAYLMTNEDYEKLDDQSKNVASILVNNLDEDIALKFKNKKDVGEYVQNILDIIKDNPVVKDALVGLFTIDISDMSVDKAKSFIDKVINIIANELGEDPLKLKSRLGFDDYDDVEPLINNVKNKLQDEFDDNVGDLTLEDLQIAADLEIPDGVLLTWDELLEKIKEAKKEKEEASQVSFDEAWKKTASETKQSLLELAKAGELTPETIKSTKEYKQLLKETGMTAEEVAEKINNMKSVSSADQLSSMKSGISSITSILGEKQNKLNDDNAINFSVGADTLAGVPEELKACTKEYDNFCKVLGSSSSTMDECKKAANRLATAYVNSNNFLAQLTNENKKYYIAQLEEMGVENAAAVVTEALNKKKGELTAAKVWDRNQTALLNGTIVDNINKLAEQKGMADSVKQALYLLALEKKTLNGIHLDTTTDIENIARLTDTILNSTKAMQLAEIIKHGDHYSTIEVKNALDELEKLSNKAKNTKAKVVVDKNIDLNEKSYSSPTPSTSSPSSDASKEASKSAKESKQEIDWISRMLDSLQKKIDLLKAKFENLFSISDKQNNLTKQIKKTTDLLNKQEKAAKRYQKIADNYYKKNKKKLSKNGITLNMLNNGSLNIKSYNSSIADIIQNYQSYADKAQDARQATQELIKEIKELSKQKLDLKLDDNERKREYQEARYNNATTTKEKNSIIDEEIDTYKSDDKAYDNYYTRAKKLRNESGETAKKAVNKSKLSSSVKKKIKNLIKNNKEIPDSLLKKVEKVSKSVYNKLIDYNNNVDFVDDVLRDKNLANEQNEKNIRDKKIEKKQNIADEYEATYNLNQQYEENAIYANDKNKYEEESYKSLEKQYDALIDIAKLEGDTVEAERLKAELADKRTESLKKQYDNIKNEYDLVAGLNNANISDIQAEIEALQQNGNNAVQDYYKKLQEYTSKNRENLVDELSALQEKQFDFEMYSDEWYEIQNDLLGIEQQIHECDSSLAEWQKTIDELNMKPFELMNTELENANEHIQFLKDYISHSDLTSKDDLGLTLKGFTTLSLDLDEMANNNKIIENAQKALKELNEQYENGIYTEEEYLEKTKEQEDIIRDSILANEDLKDSMLDLVEEAFDIQLDALNELIDKRKEALQKEKDLYEYQRKVAQQTKAIAKIQKQIAALTGDTSDEARAKIQKLQVELDEAQQDLKDTEYDKWISDQEDMLDDLAKEMEDFFDSLMKEPEKLLSAIEKAIREQPELIAKCLDEIGFGDAHSYDTVYNDDGSKTTNSTDYNGTDYQKDYKNDGTNTTNNFTVNVSPDSSNSSSNSNSIQQIDPDSEEYKELSDRIEDLAEKFNENRNNLSDDSKDAADLTEGVIGIGEELNGTAGISNNKEKIKKYLNEHLHIPKDTSEAMRIATDEFLQYLNENYKKKTLNKKQEVKIAEMLGIKFKDNNNITYKESKKLLKAFKDAGFSKGGIVSTPDTINEAISKNNDDVIGTLRVGERILDPVNADEFKKFNEMLPETVRTMSILAGRDLLNDSMYNIKPVSAKQSVSVGDISIHLDGSNVVDPDSFIDTFRKSTGMQNAIKNCVANDMVKSYKNTLGKF